MIDTSKQPKAKKKTERRSDEELLKEAEAEVKKRRAKIKDRDRRRRNHALIVIGAEYVRATGQDWREVNYVELRKYFEQFAYTMKPRTDKPMSNKADDDWRLLKEFENANKGQPAQTSAATQAAQQQEQDSEIPF